MTLRYTVDVTCPKCGADLTHCNGANPAPNLTHAVASCTSCGSWWHLHLEALAMPRPPKVKPIKENA